MEHLLSLVIGLILISVGFQVASSSADALGGVASQAFGAKGAFTQDSFFKGALGAPATIGARGARAGYRGARATAGFAAGQIESRTGAFSQLGQGITAGARELGQRGGVTNQIAGSLIASAGGAITKQAETFNKERQEAATSRNKDLTTSEKVARMDLSDPETKRWMSMSTDSRDDFEDLHRSFATDSGFRKQVKGQLTSQYGGDKAKVAAEMSRLTDQSIAMMTQDRAGLGTLEDNLSPEDKKKFKKFQVGNLDKILGGIDSDTSIAAADKDDAKRKALNDLIVDNDEFNPRDLSAEGVKLPIVQEILDGIPQKTDNQGNVIETALSNAIAGKGVDAEVRDALRGAGAKFGEDSAKILENALKFNKAGGAPGEKNLSPADITAADMSANGEAVTAALIASDRDLSTLSAAAKPAVISQAVAMRAAATDPTQRRKIDRAMFSMDGDVQEIGIDPVTGSIDANQTLTVREEIKARPESLKSLNGLAANAANGGNSTDLTKAVVDSIDASYLDSMLDSYTQATTDQMKNDLKQAMDTIRESITAEYANGDRNAGTLDRLEAKAKLIERQMS